MSHLSLSVNNSLSSQNKLPLSRQNSFSSHRTENQNSVCIPVPLTPQSSVGSNSLEEYKRNDLMSTKDSSDQDRAENINEKEHGIADENHKEIFQDKDIVSLSNLLFVIFENGCLTKGLGYMIILLP